MEGGIELEFGNELSRKDVTELKAVIEPKRVNPTVLSKEGDTELSLEGDTELSQKSETKLSLEGDSELGLEGETELASVLASLNRDDWMHYMDTFSPTRFVETHSLQRNILIYQVCRDPSILPDL